MGIKSFIYLDEYRMYSISSQIFEGLTEHIVSYSSNEEQEAESQQGPYFSGKLLADIVSKEEGMREKKFLHDYSYTLFEKKLLEDDKVILINSDNIDQNLVNLANYSFVKITGRMVLNDIEVIKSTLENFNKIGEALTIISKQQDFKGIKETYEANLQKAQNKKQITKHQERMEADILRKALELAKDSNLYQSPELLKKLVYLLDYGFKDRLEIQIPILHKDLDQKIFTSNLNRKYLKENEDLLIRKHSRFTEKEFVIFGIVTQNRVMGEDLGLDYESDDEKEALKLAIMKLIYEMSNVEMYFTGRLKNEIVVDPIAVYREL